MRHHARVDALPALLLCMVVPALLAGCAGTPSGGEGSSTPHVGGVSVVPARVSEPPGPMNASGMGAVPNPNVPPPPVSRATSAPSGE
jgi:hypothetical protein